MNNWRVALKLIGRDNNEPMGYKKITCHLIFGIKMDINRKHWYVLGGRLTNPPPFMAYLSVVRRDSLLIVLFMSDLNDLKFWWMIFKMPIWTPQPRRRFYSTQEININLIKEGQLSLSEPFTVWSSVQSHGGTIFRYSSGLHGIQVNSSRRWCMFETHNGLRWHKIIHMHIGLCRLYYYCWQRYHEVYGYYQGKVHG